VRAIVTGVEVLYLPAQESATGRALAAEASRRGVLAVNVRSQEDLVEGAAPHLFGGPALADRIRHAQPLALLEPHDGWLAALPERFRRREVRLIDASTFRSLPGRWFVKTPREKGLVEPGAYGADELTLPGDTRLLISDLVTMTSEWRFWILDGTVHTGSSYRLDGQPDSRPLVESAEGRSARDFAETVLADQADLLPSAVVVDVAWITGPKAGWAVVEANMAWFSSMYAAEVSAVLDTVLQAAGPEDRVQVRDRPFRTR
jgi:hypothetical protein